MQRRKQHTPPRKVRKNQQGTLEQSWKMEKIMSRQVRQEWNHHLQKSPRGKRTPNVQGTINPPMWGCNVCVKRWKPGVLFPCCGMLLCRLSKEESVTCLQHGCISHGPGKKHWNPSLEKSLQQDYVQRCGQGVGKPQGVLVASLGLDGWGEKQLLRLGRQPCENPSVGTSEPQLRGALCNDLLGRSYGEKGPLLLLPPLPPPLTLPPLAKPYQKPEGKGALEEEGRVNKDGSTETNTID